MIEHGSPQVSVCLLACNHASYIQQCLESAIAQADDVQVEIIVGDDASDDGTSEIVARIAAARPQLITHVRRAARIGGSANYLDVMRRATAPLIAHLDGDDFWMPGKLRQQVAYMQAHADCAAVYANARTVTEQGERVGVFNDLRRERIDLAFLLRRGNFLCNSSMLFRSALREMIFAVDGPVLDYRVHLMFAQRGGLAQLAQPLVGYRVNSAGSMVAQANDFVRNLYWQAILSVPRTAIAEADLAWGIADFHRRVAFRALRTRRFGLWREWAPRALRASPFGALRTTSIFAASFAAAVRSHLLARGYSSGDGLRAKVLYRS